MDPVFVAMLAKLGIDTAINLIAAWRRSGEPTEEQIRALKIDKAPEEFFEP